MSSTLEHLLDRWESSPGDPTDPAEIVAAAEASGSDPEAHAALRRFLEVSRKPEFLTALADEQARERWFTAALRAVDALDFDLGELLAQRSAADPDRALFRTFSGQEQDDWSYHRVRELVRATAAVFWRDGPVPALAPSVPNPVPGPRVGLFCSNGVGGAVCDLACLSEGILVSPLNIHFKQEHLVWIFNRLMLTVAVCDTGERLDQLLALRDKVDQPFTIYTLTPDDRVGRPGILGLDEERSRLGASEITGILDGRLRRDLRDIATVMFTSGSTGLPKGVAFSQRNLVSKRFARASALPFVGGDETLLCYLPLFHTFGRFLEMLGTIFWGGTYVFAGNPAADSLLNLLGKVSPTGMISVPVRWQQIADRVWEQARRKGADPEHGPHLRRLVGERLSWGLSAAGYLDPKVFRFFHRHGVRLCSGFGMTEGTGGLTMTPPDDYAPGSVGIPLPGTRVRLEKNGELQVSGCYIARYLDPADAAGSLAVQAPDSDDWWLATGDLFRRTQGRHLEIVDRIKDIYKNNRGQTIAPRAVESLFEQVPGIKRTFLAGDGRAYNTLLIVPDDEDQVLHSLRNQESRRHYFQHIITASNPSLATWERVVNFAVLDRDFSPAQGELTPKGSLRRKTIEQNFTGVIASLYRGDHRTLVCGDFQVRIPRWFFRDLGIIEDTIEAGPDGLVNTETGRRLQITTGAAGRVLLGDLEYTLSEQEADKPLIDLGVFARHPVLWLANPALIRFSPCRAGWNTGLGGVAPHVHLPQRDTPAVDRCLEPVTADPSLDALNATCTRLLFGAPEDALAAIRELDGEMHSSHDPVTGLIRSRLQAVAGHPIQEVRCRAYQVLMLDQPNPDYRRYLPVFIESGLPFLDQESFKAIARASLQPHDLTALRRRLAYYRRHLKWPADDRVRKIFNDLLHMLADFGHYHLEYYGAIRAELVAWIRHVADPEMSALARAAFGELGQWFESRLQTDYPGMDAQAWEGKLAFQEGMNEEEAARLHETLVGTTFLRESLLLACEGEDIALQEIGPGGIWVSRIISRFEDSRFRVSINTKTGKHFDLQLIIFKEKDPDKILDTIYWYLALGGCVSSRPVLPEFGSCRPDLGALSMAYTSDLTVWEKIREFSSTRGPGTVLPSRMRWRQLMVRAMGVVIRGWRQSGRRIIPGRISPYNIVVPEPDFRTGALLNNLTGWRPYTGPLSLLRPLWRNMIHHTLCHYPWTDFYLERQWLLDAVVAGMGVPEATVWLQELAAELQAGADDPDTLMWPGFPQDLEEFLGRLTSAYYPPLPLEGAIQRYDEWERSRPEATTKAKLEIIGELISLYRLDRLPDIARFTLFRRTIFRQAPAAVTDPFDRLLERMHQSPQRRPEAMVELSDLQAALADQDERLAFSRMAFPHWKQNQTVRVKTLGDPAHSQTIVHSTLHDRRGQSYTVGEPSSPEEVGLLYRLFLQAGFPKTVSPQDRHLVVMDQAEQIIAGAVYRTLDEETVFLDGIVVGRALLERGIAAGLMQDFCTRMKAAGIRKVHTQFFLRPFYEKHGFRVAKSGTALVRYL